MFKLFKTLTFAILLFCGNVNFDTLSLKLQLNFNQVAAYSPYNNEDEDDTDFEDEDELEHIEVIGEEIEDNWDDEWLEEEYQDFLEELIEELEAQIELEIERCEQSAFGKVDDCINELKEEIGLMADACYLAAATGGAIVGIYASPITGVVVAAISGSACLSAKAYDLAEAPSYCIDEAEEEAENCS